MDAYVRDFADPLEGLQLQFEELEGFARTVPPLIEADRDARWERIADGPGDGEEEIVDIYSRESGPGTGWGFARFDRTIHVAALVLGWQVFHDFLALELARAENPRRFGRRTARDEIESETTALRFDQLKSRYGKTGIALHTAPGWEAVREIHLTRNALVHNQGRYTRDYFRKVGKPRYPNEEENPFAGRGLLTKTQWHDSLADRTDVPLDFAYVRESLHRLRTVAEWVRENVDSRPSIPSGGTT